MFKYLCKVQVAQYFIDCGAQPSTQIEEAFINHISEFGYSYGTKEEYNFRLARYMKAQKSIDEINSTPSNTFRAGHNQFSTWTDEEYNQLLGEKDRKAQNTDFPYCPVEADLAESVDWRDEDKNILGIVAVNPIRNQGHCGSCWTFSAVAALEGSYAVKNYGNLQEFSEQQILDCFHDENNNGCQGGEGQDAMNWTFGNPLVRRDYYPYTGVDGQCDTTYDGYPGASAETTCSIPVGQPEEIRKALSQRPVKISVHAGDPVFRFYQDGILNTDCGEGVSDHAISSVGFGVADDGTRYFILRNSWGVGWGEQGYMRMKETEGAGLCLMNNKAYHAEMVEHPCQGQNC